MSNIIFKTKNKTFYVNTKIIKYCIFPTKYCDYTQFNSTKIHPHAAIDRGVFKENPYGYVKINSSAWDVKKGVLFSKLLEFKALKNHYTGKENWKKSKFALRNVNFIEKKNSVRGYINPKKFLIARERQIDKLFESIIKNGVQEVNISKDKKLFIDNISLALTKSKNLYFNNRGHHRLSIAKIVGVKKVPVKITISKSKKILEKFYQLHSCK